MSVLASVEVQLMLRCLDIRSRLAAARCNNQLYAAASQPFAWPQEQIMPLQVTNDGDAVVVVVQRLRTSLLRLSAIHLCIQLPTDPALPLCSELAEVPNIRSLTVQLSKDGQAVPSDCLLPLLRNSATQQLRCLDVSGMWNYDVSAAEKEQLQTLPHLHSLSLRPPRTSTVPRMVQLLPLLPALTKLSLIMTYINEAHLYPSLSQCARLVSLDLVHPTLDKEFIECLAQLPLLQRLGLDAGVVHEQDAHAWAALRSLNEVYVASIYETAPLFSALHVLPALRLLRWNCHRGIPSVGLLALPTLESLRPLVAANPLLRVKLLLPRTFDEWWNESMQYIRLEPREYYCRVWTALHHSYPAWASSCSIRTTKRDECKKAHVFTSAMHAACVHVKATHTEFNAKSAV
jgi:hypothetical protein